MPADVVEFVGDDAVEGCASRLRHVDVTVENGWVIAFYII